LAASDISQPIFIVVSEWKLISALADMYAIHALQ